jgi:hypothetical protein
LFDKAGAELGRLLRRSLPGFDEGALDAFTKNQTEFSAT